MGVQLNGPTLSGKQVKTRQLQVEEVCQQFTSELYLQEVPLEMLFFIPQYNLLYCSIQKAGTSTWIQGPIWRLATKVSQTERSIHLKKSVRYQFHLVD